MSNDQKLEKATAIRQALGASDGKVYNGRGRVTTISRLTPRAGYCLAIAHVRGVIDPKMRSRIPVPSMFAVVLPRGCQTPQMAWSAGCAAAWARLSADDRARERARLKNAVSFLESQAPTFSISRATSSKRSELTPALG